MEGSIFILPPSENFFQKDSVPFTVFQASDKVRPGRNDLPPKIKVVIGPVKDIHFPRQKTELQTDRRIPSTTRGNQEVVDPLSVHVPNDVKFCSGLVADGVLLFPARLGKKAAMDAESGIPSAPSTSRNEPRAAGWQPFSCFYFVI